MVWFPAQKNRLLLPSSPFYPLTWGPTPTKLFTAAESRETKAVGGIRIMRKLFTILLILGAVALPVFAGAITDLGLFNTGSAGWQVGGVAATTATTIPGGGFPWAANTGTSSWISTQADASIIRDGASQAAPYLYTFQFTVPTKYTLSSILITGKWALDDFGTASAGSTVFSTMPDGVPISFNPRLTPRPLRSTRPMGWSWA